MILTKAHGSTRTETCPAVALSTTNPTWPGVAEENSRIEHMGDEGSRVWKKNYIVNISLFLFFDVHKHFLSAKL